MMHVSPTCTLVGREDGSLVIALNEDGNDAPVIVSSRERDALVVALLSVVLPGESLSYQHRRTMLVQACVVAR